MLQNEINRRDALQRVAWILGSALSIELTAGVNGQILNLGSRVSVAPEQVDLIAELADVILPTTATPGAKAAAVEQFIVRVMRDCYRYTDQEEFYRSLEKFRSEALKRFGKPFQELDSEQKNTFVKQTAAQQKSFFLKMRQLTITGYFTSEIGATKALEYLPIPGRFEGAVAMRPGQKAWAI